MLKELHDEAVVPREGDLETLVDVRATMILEGQIASKIEKTKATKRAVVDSYDHEIAALEERREGYRGQIERFLEASGENAEFPDVGTAYLATEPEKMELVDAAAIPDDLRKTFTLTHTVEKLDVAAVKSEALERLRETGELVPGFDLKPETKSLRIRKRGGKS